MNDERLMQVLLSPHISEKTNRASERHDQYTFKVRTDATKSEIKRAVEKVFSVKVLGVQTMCFQGKQKRFAQRLGRRVAWKKAQVRLEASQTIDFTDLAIGK